MYEKLKDLEFQYPRSRTEKWSHDLSKDFKEYFALPNKCTSDTKLIYFQYRILCRFLTTNTFLQKIGEINSSQCTFCKENPETLLHLFTACKKVMPIWNCLKLWFHTNYTGNVSLDPVSILLGNPNGTALL